MVENSPIKQPCRYTNKPFPEYRYIPGENPHPTRDPKGHSYNKPVNELSGFSPEEWSTCKEYLFGIDLFNFGYWWEAHEVLEAVWISAGRNTDTGLFVQGLIQLSAAHLKGLQGYRSAARKLTLSGLSKMKDNNGKRFGIDISKLRSDIEEYLSGNCATPITIELDKPANSIA